jgi:hypothetical protein
MIDLSAFGLSSVQTNNAGNKRDKAVDNGKDAKNFGDFVNAAGKNNKRNAANDDAANLKADDADTAEASVAADAAVLRELDEPDMPDERRTDMVRSAERSAADTQTTPKVGKFAGRRCSKSRQHPKGHRYIDDCRCHQAQRCHEAY